MERERKLKKYVYKGRKEKRRDERVIAKGTDKQRKEDEEKKPERKTNKLGKSGKENTK